MIYEFLIRLVIFFFFSWFKRIKKRIARILYLLFVSSGRLKVAAKDSEDNHKREKGKKKESSFDKEFWLWVNSPGQAEIFIILFSWDNWLLFQRKTNTPPPPTTTYLLANKSSIKNIWFEFVFKINVVKLIFNIFGSFPDLLKGKSFFIKSLRNFSVSSPQTLPWNRKNIKISIYLINWILEEEEKMNPLKQRAHANI